MATATTEVAAPIKPRIVFEHVWKTGGTELCKLARANGWKVPEAPGCTLFVHPHQGWPTEDYDMIGNEGAIPSGEVVPVYRPQNAFINNTEGRYTIEGVKWVTTLRHPYSRTLSHYYHATKSKAFHNLTLEEFLSKPLKGAGGFGTFIDNHQTRWHCGTGPCVSNRNEIVTHEMLEHAIQNLNKMHAVLILEDMASPESCTRRQMRHVLNFTRLESFSDQTKNDDKSPHKPDQRNSQTNWENVIRPFLGPRGHSTNKTMLRGFGWATDENNSTSTTMASLGLHNDKDLQLYGYARHLCEVLADKYDQQANASSGHHQAHPHNTMAADLPMMTPTINSTALPTHHHRPANGSASSVLPIIPTDGFLGAAAIGTISSIHVVVLFFVLVVCQHHVCKWKRHCTEGFQRPT